MRNAQAASLRLADRTEDRLAALWRLYDDGNITLPEFKTLSAQTVTQANTAATQLADVAVAAEATRARGETVALAGLRPNEAQLDETRVRRDIDRILADTPDVGDLAVSREAALRRLGRSEPLLTTATAVQAAMAHHDASGWVRELDADPCKLCQGWADGVVRSIDTAMARHLGCGCIQQPVF